MKAIFTGLFLGLIFFSSQAQKVPVKFGEVSLADLTMKSYEKDSSASAVILADYGESVIVFSQSSGFSVQFDRIKRIKIFTKDGLKWGDFSIALYKSGSADEKLSGMKATTYNLENGKVVETKLKNDGIFKENYDANTDLVKITFPNVREGSVVEISYRVNSEFLFNFQDWDFQSTIPTVLSEYRIKIPEYFNYDKYMQGYVALDISDETTTSSSIVINSFEREDNGRTVQSTHSSDKIDFMELRNRWVANHVPSFSAEPFMTSLNDYLSKIKFQLAFVKFPDKPLKQYMGSWEDINKTFNESDDFGGQIKANGFLQKTVDEITTGLTTEVEKIEVISNYVKTNVVWDGSKRKYPGLPLRKVLENKIGNSAEINLLLTSMLEKANIKVWPVLISTRDHGLVREETAVSSQFNYVICLARVNEKVLLLDAPEKLLPTGMLPERCLNGRGFAVSKEGFQWIALGAKFKTRMVTSADLILSDDGALSGKLRVDCNGYQALEKRKNYLADGKTEYLKNLVGSHAWELKASDIQNANENMTLAGEMIYVDPFISSSYKNNPFKSEVREYPVDFGSPVEDTFFFKLTVPANYVVDEMPKSKIILMPENGAKYIYNVSQNGNLITVTSMFHINKSLFTQIEYPALREFYSQIVSKQAEQIVLKKK